MGKGKPVIMFIFAIVVALFFTVLTYRYIQNIKNQQAKVKPAEKVPVIKTKSIAVADLDLSWGTSLTEAMIKMKPYLDESLPPGFFPEDKKSELTGRTLIYPVKAGEPILESKLAPATPQTGGVAAVITPEKRAMSVKIDKVSGVSGFIFPGHRVDVLVTLRSGTKRNEPVTKTVLENILVLAVGTEMERAEHIDKKEKPTKIDVITLELTPEEAEKLALAATQGSLLLALRNFSDTNDVITDGMTIPVLLSSYTSASPEGKRKSPKRRRSVQARKPVFYVELIKGDKVTKLRFKNGR